MAQSHIPVLLEEALQGLAIKADGLYVDATFGRGGHAKELMRRLGPAGKLIALDKDPEAIASAETQTVFDDIRFCLLHASFATIEQQIKQLGLHEKIDGILLDLGVSSPQLDEAKRGFSFSKDGPLDMRMNNTQGMDSATWINQAAEADICHVIRHYGEERYARRIARAIARARHVQPITRTQQLSEIISQACPSRERKKHPATRTFQAIRIFINQELQELSQVLQQSLNILCVGGRICVISFHSLEDRIVKQFIRRESQGKPLPRDLPVRASEITCRLKKIGSMTKATEQEIMHNPRARSARLRIAEKLV